jgi:protocatechuate 3,4-dioxygenase beta subunit
MVSIKLIRASTGNPVKQTDVRVWQGGAYTAATSNEGIAHFESVSPGRYPVSAEGKELGEYQLEGLTVVYTKD